MNFRNFHIKSKGIVFLMMLFSFVTAYAQHDLGNKKIVVATKINTAKPLKVTCNLNGTQTKRISITLTNLGQYGSLSIYANGDLLAENLNVPNLGQQVIHTLVRFKELGTNQLELVVRDAAMLINTIEFQDMENLAIPVYEDISVKAGMDKVSSIKYGGPTIADIDQDGDYDFIVNNHNAESSKLYWNNGDGTVTKHEKNLARWFMHDLHGTTAGDYDNDGDLDLIVTQGGGNGKNPSKASFYKNDNSNLIRFTGDVGIDRGGRGRTARWSDMDLDGDLDLLLVNETSLKKEKPQHFFYENKGDGTFKFKSVDGIQDVHQSRVLVTDLNGDNIDDFILYGPLSIWLGNGDFSFREVTQTALQDLHKYEQIMALADLDIDNDGDLDLYLARGKAFEGGFGESPSLDKDFQNKKMSIKSRGFEGIDEFDFEGDGKIKLHDYYYLAQGAYRGKTYPIVLGEKMQEHLVKSGEEFEFDKSIAMGFPEHFPKSGLYIGYMGNDRWKAALVRKKDIFWGYKFSFSGVTSVTPKFMPNNRNEADVLLLNENGVFKDVSKSWNLPSGGNSLGVTVGDFNNDSFQDIFVYRWGFIGSRTTDIMLLNTGNGGFETVTMHGANDIGGPGNGDMGQAFDFDNDGDVDLLNGSENGEWYLFSNKNATKNGNYVTVKVGYAPKSNVDAISAEVIVNTSKNRYRKRVGSAGEVFSQSLLNRVHFGLGKAEKIERIQVRWRDGETIIMKDMPVNSIVDTDNVNPEKITITTQTDQVRKGTSIKLVTQVEPINANKKVLWSSSDEKVLKVDDQGDVTAVGAVGQSAVITGTCETNGLSTNSEIKIIAWFAMPITEVKLEKSALEMIENQKISLQKTIMPTYADDQSLIWTSNAPEIATVNRDGIVQALKQGKATVNVISNVNNQIADAIAITVKPLIQPYAKILNKDELEKLTIGDRITVTAEYHAGMGNTVINADEGGVRFWFRHFKNKWIPLKDVVLVDERALKRESGKVSQTFSLADYIPTAELPEEQFYQIRVTFTSSDGNTYEDGLYPLQLKKKAE